MRNVLFTFAMLGLLGLAVAGCQNKTAMNGSGQCMCADGMAGKTVWCEKCGVGFIDGQKITCKGCYTAKNGGPACPVHSSKM